MGNLKNKKKSRKQRQKLLKRKNAGENRPGL